MTFDTTLSFQSQQLMLHEEPISLSMFPADTVVMEIKVNERIPYWLTELVAAHNLSLFRISKYCRSIEMAQTMPNTFSRFALSTI